MNLSPLVAERSVIVCCGSGGVGKTTTAAALALEAARLGRRAVVVTIDPAKRLADALGLEHLTNEPSRVVVDTPGQLWAMMLDTRATFDGLVSRYSGGPDQAARIVENRFYRNISGSLSGTQEYMAAEKLYELHRSQELDLVVVDTPPSRNALDFLDAPGRLTRFLDHRLYRVLTAPSRGVLRPVNLAAQSALKAIAKVVGANVIDDAITFFRAFDGMEAGFRSRADDVSKLLFDSATAYVLVASPRRDTIAEAAYFAGRLSSMGIQVAALVVNRVHPRFGDGSSHDAQARADEASDPVLAVLYANLAELRAIAEHEREGLLELTRQVEGASVVEVPLFGSDIHDMDALAGLRPHLFGQ